jgi:hypothetical protein
MGRFSFMRHAGAGRAGTLAHASSWWINGKNGHKPRWDKREQLSFLLINLGPG